MLTLVVDNCSRTDRLHSAKGNETDADIQSSCNSYNSLQKIRAGTAIVSSLLCVCTKSLLTLRLCQAKLDTGWIRPRVGRSAGSSVKNYMQERINR